MIEPIDNGRLRCLSCGREWTPHYEGQLPVKCPACTVCVSCESVYTSGGRHPCQQQRMAV